MYMESEELEHILDGRMKPRQLKFSFLSNITQNFSEEREIGKGGFATVYKGVLPNRNVAVKRIMNSHTINDDLFYREVDSLLAVNHQNIVQFLGYCASTDLAATPQEGTKAHIYAEQRERLLCFEYIGNGSLHTYITDELRGLEWNARYEIIKGICNGLDYLHNEKRIYHMDLKPANVLLDSNMVPKITDFGQSRYDEKSQTISITRYGSRGYCPPEYTLFGQMSPKSDMYSLGTIIIELVTGEKEIPNNNKSNVLRRWRHRWKKTGKENPLVYQQVTKCIEVGLLCQKIEPSERPSIGKVIRDIKEIDNADGQSRNAYESFSLISPYPEDDMLGIEPLELHFPSELNEQISCSLRLTNQTNAYIAFNIQKMSHLPYCMQPNKDIVPPQSKCSVDITLHMQDKAPRDRQRSGEFIVWSTKVNDGLAAEDITTNMFNTECGVVDGMKLDVVFDAEESTIVSNEFILHSSSKDMSNIDGTVGDVKKSQEYLLHNHQETAKESSGTQQASDKSSEPAYYKASSSHLQEMSLGSKSQEKMIRALKLKPEQSYAFLKKITNDFAEDRKISGSPFGSLYKGIVAGSGIVIAVMKFQKTLSMPADKIFKKEVQNVMVLKHENIVEIVSYCSETSKKLVMFEGSCIPVDINESLICYEYLPKGSLKEILLGTKATTFGPSKEDWDTSFKILKGICRGLHYLHTLDNPIIHMDLKPENILLDANLVPKIADFALSRVFGQEQTRLCTRTDMGSLGYIAPEYFYRGEISAQSDIYSLGLMILEITTREQNSREDRQPSARKYIEKIQNTWKLDHIAFKYSSLSADGLQQVDQCIKIGLECVNTDRKLRPSIERIVDRLNGIRCV